MRRSTILVALLALTGCDRTGPDGTASNGADQLLVPAAITFDGAGSTGETRLVHGERLSWVLGCQGCHTKGLGGQNFTQDKPEYGVVYASNLTRSVPTMSDAQLDAILRKGAHPTRPQMWIMPSENFQHLSDADTGALIAYLRSLKAVGEPSPPPVLGPKAKAEIAAGKIKTAAKFVRDPIYRLPPDLGAATSQGRYIVSLTCAECHGGQLEGGEDTPDLVVAAGYSRAEFETLLTAGVASGNRKLKNERMSIVARSRYAKMTRAERDSVYAYLKARAERSQ